MKRILLAFFLAAAVILSLTACGSTSTSSAEEKEPESAATETSAASPSPAPVELTKYNVGNYIAFRGEYTDSEYHSSILYYVSTSTIDFQAYGTSSGSFNNVEITVRAKIDSDLQGVGEKWHLTDTDDNEVEFTFRMPSSGDYSSSYGIECDRNSRTMAGSCDFEVIAVTGKFIPAY